MAVLVRHDLGDGASLERVRSILGPPRPASVRTTLRHSWPAQPGLGDPGFLIDGLSTKPITRRKEEC